MGEDWRKVSVEQWGYSCGEGQEASALVWPVRFKPAVTLILVVLGFILRRGKFLIALGGMGILGSFIQSASWIDLLYNHLVRRVFKAPALGPDPALRRWLCGMADLFVLFSGAALLKGAWLLAGIFAYIVILLAGSVVLTGICLPAYLFYLWRRR